MSEATATVHDPICHMDIAPASAAGITDYNGSTYYFCSGGCKKDFDADPEGSLKAESEYDHSNPVNHMMMMEEEEAEVPGAHVHVHSHPHPEDAAAKKKPWWRFW